MPELFFKGKEFVYNHHLAVPFRPLEPQADKSIGDVQLDGNLIIYGDNLHALKALLPMYAGKVDCIFIDPPYNTGHEGWCYNDNVNSPVIQEWLNNNPVGIEDGLRHDKWCAMMWPRLRLLHELLCDTGSIWVTLDDNEVHNAICMLNEIFGELNHIAQIAWEKVYSPRMDAHGFSKDFDSLLVYAKDIDQVILNKVVFSQNDRAFTYVEPETNRNARLRTLRKEGSNSLRSDRPNMWYPIPAPDGTEIWPIKPDGTEGCWRWEKANFEREYAKTPSKVLIQQNGEGHWEVFVKQYFKGDTDRPPSSIFRHTDYGHTHEASGEIKAIFGGRGAFATPKPTKLIRGILSLALPEDGLIIDSFAGSGTTAHAVLAENKEDGGNRKFILVECEDYANEITAERVRRVINGYSFSGKQRKELLREKITWTKLRRRSDLIQKVDFIERTESKRFGRINKSVKNGELIVIGETESSDIVEGLGGKFTYCSLGPPIDFDRLLTGESLPSFEALGSVLFHTATNQAFDAAQMDINPLGLDGHGYLGRSESTHIWLIYKPDLDFLKSRDAALTMAKAETIADRHPGERHLVFAPARFVSQKMLNEANLPVEFAPLPFALYRIERGSLA